VGRFVVVAVVPQKNNRKPPPRVRFPLSLHTKMAFHFESTEISTKRAREDDLTDVLGSAKKGKVSPASHARRVCRSCSHASPQACNGGPYELHIGGMEVDMDCEMEGDTEGMGGLLSNPDHRWETTAAPRMLHHGLSPSIIMTPSSS
jgi:hypothetical protein